MRSFNKLANLHRVFFKKAEESFANKTTNSPIDGLNKGIMEGGEKYPGQFMSLANPANNQSYFNNHNMPRAHAGPGHSRMATGIDAPASTGARPSPSSFAQKTAPKNPMLSQPPAGPGRSFSNAQIDPAGQDPLNFYHNSPTAHPGPRTVRNAQIVRPGE